MAAKELRTFSDIYNAVIEELKVQSTDTTQLNRIKRDINMIYLDEVYPHTSWYWARKNVDVVHKAEYTTGTASVTKSSNNITLTNAPTDNKTGLLFKINGFAEIYTIRSHSGTSIVLETPFTNTTNATATFKIFDKGVVLPVDILETYKVWHDHHRSSMNPLGDKEFLETTLAMPMLEGRPCDFRVTDWVDPNPFDVISGLPALSTRASSGLVKTLVFASTVASYLEEGDFIRISLAGDESYNGEFIIEDVTTTTITYISNKKVDETAAADATLVLELTDGKDANEVYRKIEVYPYIYDNDTTIHVEGIKRVPALENDSDEPLMPLHDRLVLVYGALYKGWARVRNPKASSDNYQLFQKKLNRMAGKIQDSTDGVNMKIGRNYLRGKRRYMRRNRWYSF